MQTPTTPSDPTDLGADALSRAIHARRISCRELMRATLDRVARLNPAARAIVSLAPEDALLRQADACDADLAAGRSRGWLHGIPQAIKDTAHATGFPTTYGSPLLKDAMPAQDSLYVARMKAAGCLVIGKTNMPEFGLGSHSFNPLFGATANAWDPSRSAGGSSGGAAVALALRLLPAADGSDFMGSLRNPAAWNHVFGLRPSAGRVPGHPKPELYLSQLATDGPMARSVGDLARLLAIQSGFDPRVPLSLDDPRESLVPGPDVGAESLRGLRIGWLGDLDGHLPMEPGVLEVCENALHRMADAGAHLAPARPDIDLDAVWQAWMVWRHALVAPSVAAAMRAPEDRAQVKPEALWELDLSRDLRVDTLRAASERRGALLHALLALFERYDVLALPAAQCWPFDIDWRWPREIAGRPMDTYHRWMEVTIYATLAGLPAISVPAGFDPGGRWPMGLQLIGPPRADAALLRAAAGYEATATELLARRPPEPPRTQPDSSI